MGKRSTPAEQLERRAVEWEVADMVDSQFVAESTRVDSLSTITAGVNRE